MAFLLFGVDENCAKSKGGKDKTRYKILFLLSWYGHLICISSGGSGPPGNFACTEKIL